MPDMPEEEPKFLAMEEEKLQNTILRNQNSAYSNALDRKLQNGASIV